MATYKDTPIESVSSITNTLGSEDPQTKKESDLSQNKPDKLDVTLLLQSLNFEKKYEHKTSTNADTATADTRGSVDLQEKDLEDSDLDKTLAEIHQLDQATLPPELQSLDVGELIQLYNKPGSISVLVTGKTGSGKSTLTNGILGLKVEDNGSAQEGDCRKPCTKEITEYQTRKGGIDVTVWDSPGLQDGTKNQEEYLKQMKSQCSRRDLTVYCVNISQRRFVRGDDNPDVLAMKKLTRKFGNEFWSNTVIVLTYANTLEAFHVDWIGLSKEKKAEAFLEIIKEWGKDIKEVLIQDVLVPGEYVESISVVPAGHYMIPHLPGCRFWLSVLWFHCVCTISTTEKKVAMVRLNAERFKREEDVTEEDFRKPAEEQPVVVSRETLLIRQGALIGWNIGEAVGALATFTWPELGATLGAFVGEKIGFGIAVFVALLHHIF